MGFQFVFFSCTSAHSPPFWGRVEMKQKTMHQFWPHLFFLVVIKSVEADWLQDPVSHVKCHVALADCGGAEIGWFLFEPPEMGMGFEETSGNTNLTCCYSLTVENALIKWKGKLCPIAREMCFFFFQIGFCSEPQNPPNRWVQSGFPVGYETTTSLEHRNHFASADHSMTLMSPISDEDGLFFDSSAHRSCLRCFVQVRCHMKGCWCCEHKLVTSKIYWKPWFSKDPKCETDTNSKYPSNQTHLGNLRCAFAVYLFWAMWRVSRILAQHYVCLRYPVGSKTIFICILEEHFVYLDFV